MLRSQDYRRLASSDFDDVDISCPTGWSFQQPLAEPSCPNADDYKFERSDRDATCMDLEPPSPDQDEEDGFRQFWGLVHTKVPGVFWTRILFSFYSFCICDFLNIIQCI